MGFFLCLIYLALIGIISFLTGRVLSEVRFSFEEFPFRSLPVESGGKIYQRIKVHRWKESFPDMSRIFPFLMPSKRLPKAVTTTQIERMIQETCIAELVHGLLGVLGFGCILIWKSIGGWIISALYMFGNLPYIIIQRYNRPKLVSILHRMRKRESKIQHIE
ncbi:glycosyl-4,4'-diaponeurosporenoate acyltransferase [Lachnospiraceae bacterium 29-91]